LIVKTVSDPDLSEGVVAEMKDLIGELKDSRSLNDSYVLGYAKVYKVLRDAESK